MKAYPALHRRILLPLLMAGILLNAFIMPLLATDSADAVPASVTPWQSKVDPWVLDTAANGETEFLVFLAEQADLAPAAALPTKAEKGQYVYDALTAAAERAQGPLLATLRERGVQHRSYWIANMIWVRGDLATIQALAARADVAHLYANPQVHMEEPAARDPEPLAGPEALEPTAIEWNITKVNAPSVWAAGFNGQGAVIAGQDTGYQWDHPALKGKYRGWSGTTADHNYNWHDAIHSGSTSCGVNAAAPCDDQGHGTHTMGTMVGDDGGSNQIGMAPGAKWIGCRNMAAGVGTPTTYSECYQWFIAPTKIDGTGADPSKAPDVINNSWGCPTSEGCTDPNVLLSVVQAVRAAGIVTVHSAGNSGSSCSSVNEPAAIYAESFSVGATTSTDAIASYSSRGPVTVDGSNRLKPNISAPGSSVRSAYPTSTYTSMSGTSMAGPHVAGLIALLISADPTAAGQVDYLEDVIEQSAVHLTSTQTCGGVSGSTIPNNTFGWGRINALAAYDALLGPFVVSAPEVVTVCAPANAAITVNVSPRSGSFSDPVTLSVSGNPAGTTASFSVNPVTPPGASTLTIGNTAAAATGTYGLTITGAAGAATYEENALLSISTASPGATALTAPADGVMNQLVTPVFTWNAASQAAGYDIQVATDPAFSSIVASATGLISPTFTPAAALASNTVYYWRVRATNGCGIAAWSQTAAFRTAVSVAADYSDLASSYGVAWHTGAGALRLGSLWTTDAAFAAGHDDPTGGDGSDDGVTPAPNAWWGGGRGAFDVSANGDGCLNGWMDFGNGTSVGSAYADGDFGDSYGGVSEQIITAQSVSMGSTNITFTVPSGILGAGANTYAFRFRLTTRKAGAACTDVGSIAGGATAGEVEDYRLTFAPLAVTLAGFTAEATAAGVTLAWETVSETGHAGFNVYRADAAAGPWQRLNGALIPAAAPGSGQGGAYGYIDGSVQPGGTYWYALEDVALDGAVTRHAPISVTVGQPNAVSLAGFAAGVGPAMAGPALAGLVALGLAALAGISLRRQQ